MLGNERERRGGEKKRKEEEEKEKKEGERERMRLSVNRCLLQATLPIVLSVSSFKQARPDQQLHTYLPTLPY